MMMPTRLQLGPSRLLPANALRRFLDKSWIRFRDSAVNPSLLRAMARCRLSSLLSANFLILAIVCVYS
jgi:hypothetical protein